MHQLHLRQWEHNRRFLEAIPPVYPDWAVTAVFYSALHAVDALLAFDRAPEPVGHKERNAALKQTNRYRKIWNCYMPLYDLSRTVRYMADPAAWVPWAKVESEIIRRYLLPLEASVFKLLNQDSPLSIPVLQRESPRSN